MEDSRTSEEGEPPLPIVQETPRCMGECKDCAVFGYMKTLAQADAALNGLQNEEERRQRAHGVRKRHHEARTKLLDVICNVAYRPTVAQQQRFLREKERQFQGCRDPLKQEYQAVVERTLQSAHEKIHNMSFFEL